MSFPIRVETGGKTSILISPVLNIFRLELKIVEVFETTTGIIGIPACLAKWKAPF